ncbi:hypothetical protein IR166_31025, partial [Enterococcus faecalis]|nr:hypothetical protein [Enterococcus faecalis]
PSSRAQGRIGDRSGHTRPPGACAQCVGTAGGLLVPAGCSAQHHGGSVRHGTRPGG